jgi:hypothetical protein
MGLGKADKLGRCGCVENLVHALLQIAVLARACPDKSQDEVSMTRRKVVFPGGRQIPEMWRAKAAATTFAG